MGRVLPNEDGGAHEAHRLAVAKRTRTAGAGVRCIQGAPRPQQPPQSLAEFGRVSVSNAQLYSSRTADVLLDLLGGLRARRRANSFNRRKGRHEHVISNGVFLHCE